MFFGEFAQAREHLEQGIALYNPQQHHPHAFLYGVDPGVLCRSITAVNLWLLGYPTQALKRSHDALTLAQEFSHPFSVVYALHWVAGVHQLRREGQATQEWAEGEIALSGKHGFELSLAFGTIPRGWALTEQGQEEEGIAQMLQGLTAWRETGAELWRPYFLALLAEACGRMGQTGEGLALLAEALDVVEKTGERFYETELYRLKGELMLAQEGYRLPAVGLREKAKEAEECFHKAIEIARKQQAKSLELRAVMSLARLWQQQGKRAEARQMLAEIYGWFTEGFATRDSQEAKALLEELTAC
jgi:predicted ATPase